MKRISLILMISILAIFSMISQSDAVLQTAAKIQANIQPGGSETFQWGLDSESDEIITMTLRAEGTGAEFLSFPKTLEVLPNQWNWVDITVAIPKDHPNDVFLEPAVYALMQGEKGGVATINIQMKKVITIIIGNPVIPEVQKTTAPKTAEETLEEKPVKEKDDGPSGFTLSSADSEEGGGCLISTAAYGSEIASQVQTLREIRDNSLLKTSSGSTFMAGFNTLYYSFSPTIADMERQSPIFREAVKITITPLLTSLSILNYVDMDSEAEVLGYGISLIVLNVGMYFVAPTMIILRLKR